MARYLTHTVQTFYMKVSFLIPCYNEEDMIRRAHKQLRDACKKLKLDYEIILEQDGSTDKTGEIISDLTKKDRRVVSLSFTDRKGKGWGLQQAFNESNGDIIVFVDADMPFDMGYLGRLLEETKNSDVVIASRYLGSRRKLPMMRVITSRIYNLINRALFGIRVRDTQSSMQLFRKEVLKKVGSWPDGFEYNVWVLARASRLGFSIIEIGVPYEHRKGGKFSMGKHGMKTLIRTLKLATRV